MKIFIFILIVTLNTLIGDDKVCLDVISYATNPMDDTCVTFPDSCTPQGWKACSEAEYTKQQSGIRWTSKTSVSSLVNIFAEKSFDISGYYIHYAPGIFNWIYVDKNAKFLGKLERGSNEDGSLRWTKIQTDKIKNFTSIEISADKTKVMFGSKDVYHVGHDTLDFQDPNRRNYHVTAEIFYPSQKAGLQSPIAESHFPLIIFAHGYQQLYSDYHYLYDALVPQGYIIAFLTTKQGATIDLDSYADDINALYTEIIDTTHTILSGHLSGKSALMGHSTGGGAIYLAQAMIPQNTTLVSLAALGEAYGPISGGSPVSAAVNITASTLILSGEKDCITPVKDHQKPLYDAFGGEKSMMTIVDGDHCGFSDSTNCPTAETLSCGIFFQGDTIAEATQRSLTLQEITPWLDKFLKD
jgi:pimeloyl-ACP methyl ester carboxylesterase